MTTLRVTDLRGWKECRRKFYFSKVLRLKLKPDGSVSATDWGSLGHKCIELSDLQGDPPQTYFPMVAEEAGISPSAEDTDMWLRLLQMYEEVVGQPSRKYWSNIKTEINLRWELPNGVAIEGQIDKMGTYQGRTWFRDYKFLSRLPKTKVLELDYQMSLYFFLARKNYPEEPVVGAWYTVILKRLPTVPEPLKNGRLSTARTVIESCTYDSYLEGIRRAGLNPNDYLEVLESLENKDNTTIHEFPIRRTSEEVGIIEQHLIHETNDLLACGDDPYKFYPNVADHCSWCDYFVLCKATIQDAVTEPILSMYIKKSDGER
jgi:hypothetical protein